MSLRRAGVALVQIAPDFFSTLLTIGGRKMKAWSRFPRTSAWFFFWSGLAVVLFIDHYLRVASGWALHGGLPEFGYYGVPALLALVSSLLLWRATRTYKKFALRVLELVAHLGVATIAYLFALFVYVTETGIDSL